MKIRFMATAMLLCFTFSQTTINAQTTEHAQGNKGHFVFGTNLVNYMAGGSSYNDYSGDKKKDSSKDSFSDFAFSLNVWAGYFVSDKVCVGLNFGNTNGVVPYYNGLYNGYVPPPVFGPSSLFFRWYMLSGDTNVVDFYLEGLIGGSYSSSKFGSGDNAGSATPVNQFVLNGNINAVFSFNVSKHFAIPLKFGFICTYYQLTSPATGTQPSSKQESFSPALIASLGLQYRL